MSEKQIITVHVLDQEEYGAGPFDFGASYTDGSLSRVIQSLLNIRDTIPAEYRSVARCQINSIGSYEDSHYARIEVNFPRIETDAECAARLEQRRAAAASREADERRQFELLKAKFG